MNDYINYYDLLGINKNANTDEIKKAYRENAKKWHPDLNKDPKAPEMAKKINEAKEILLNEEKRKEYDSYLENYKSKIYDNLNKNTADNKTYTKKQSTNNNYEEKTYTKWEYFILYLKYYKINIFRKIIAVIFVLLESLLCSILQIINYCLAFLIAYFGYYISYGLLILGGILLVLIIIKPIFKLSLPPNNIPDYFIMIIGSILSIILGSLLNYIPFLLINKIPILISKLNMFLFKLSIGYKKND